MTRKKKAKQEKMVAQQTVEGHTRFSTIPLYWLSAPNHSAVIRINEKLSLLLIKTPLPSLESSTMDERIRWGVEDVINYTKEINGGEESKLIAFNVSPTLNLINPAEWEESGVVSGGAPISKEYDPESIDHALDSLKNLVGSVNAIEERTVILIYSRLGSNRPAVLATRYLKDLGVENAFEKVPNALDFGVFSPEAAHALNRESQPVPIWRRSKAVDTQKNPSFTCGLAMKWSKYKADKVTRGDKEAVRSTIGNIALTHHVPYQDQDISSGFECSFIPRGIPRLLIILQNGKVCIRDSSGSNHFIKAEATCPRPTVVSCIFVGTRDFRNVCVLTDLLLFNGNSELPYSISDRLAVIHSIIVPSISVEKNPDVAPILFVARPLTNVTDAWQILRDRSKFLTVIEGIEFISANGAPSESIILPLEPTIVLRFEMNSNDTAVLLAATGVGCDYAPIAAMKAPGSAYRKLSSTSVRVALDGPSGEWSIVECGLKDESCANVQEAMLYIATKKVSVDATSLLDSLK